MLRGALLGTGNIARLGHLPSYTDSPDVAERLSIVAAADPCPDNLAALSQALPHARLYRDAEALLAAERLDFVDICAPPFAHGRLIELAAERGCHILCEKPLATDLGVALDLRRRLAMKPLVVMPCHQYHYAPQWLTLRRALLSGEAGRIHTGVVTVQRVGANPGTPAWRPAWRTERMLAGGGILVDHGAHLFYQLMDVFGAPESVACVTEQRLAQYEVDDTATVMLRFPHALVRLNLTWAARARYSGHRYFGEHGEVRCLDDRVELTGACGTRTIDFAAGLSHGSAHAEWFSPLLLEFAERVERGDYRLDRLDEAVAVATCITLAYRSAELGGRPLAWAMPACDGRAQPPLALESVGLVAAD